jgi:anti-anti-sigma factor
VRRFAMATPSSAGWAVLRVAGEIDLARLEELEDLIASNCNGDCSDTVVDLSDVEFMDSTGMAWLLRSRDIFLDRDHRFAVVVPTSLDRIFDLTGLGSAFEILLPNKLNSLTDEGSGT